MQTLKDFFLRHPKAALAYSGGVDSVYLLYAGRACGVDIRPYFIKTPFQPESEYREARRLAESIGVSMQTVELDVLALRKVAENPAGRCYHCKKALFSALLSRAAGDGYALVLDGTNASDDSGDRPGMRALAEYGVVSPLRQCGLTKADIRALSRVAGLPTWDKPSKSCLATRIPTGREITRELLTRVDAAEEALERLGFRDLRVRVLDDTAKIQLPEDQLRRAVEVREAIVDCLAPYFSAVTLDLRPRVSRD